MAKHRLDHGKPLFPDPMGTATDITDETERYAHFEREAVAAKNALRKVRDLKLAETDWTQNLDVPEATRNKWLAYRQALRDVPANYNNFGDVIWPTKPS
tara:strand:- start:154 stop:450 length:297 start_codon:yes stop_codon:yes gene_type:complete